jgi:hypothetical protein
MYVLIASLWLCIHSYTAAVGRIPRRWRTLLTLTTGVRPLLSPLTVLFEVCIFVELAVPLQY